MEEDLSPSPEAETPRSSPVLPEPPAADPQKTGVSSEAPVPTIRPRPLPGGDPTILHWLVGDRGTVRAIVTAKSAGTATVTIDPPLRLGEGAACTPGYCCIHGKQTR
jgi:hypothetical protein